jgi:hypothetical protein
MENAPFDVKAKNRLRSSVNDTRKSRLCCCCTAGCLRELLPTMKLSWKFLDVFRGWERSARHSFSQSPCERKAESSNSVQAFHLVYGCVGED